MGFQGFANARTPRVLHFSAFIGASVCLSVKSHLTSGASVRPENTVTYSAGNGGQKVCGVFFEIAPFKSYGVKGSERANMLIRSSLLWLTSDRVFLFDVQRSTSGYCMREYKHAYCSGQSYSASSSNLEFQSHVPFQNSRTRVIDLRTRGRRGFCTLVHSFANYLLSMLQINKLTQAKNELKYKLFHSL